MKLNLAIVEDIKDLAETLQMILATYDEIEKVNIFGSAEELLSNIPSPMPEVVLMDFGLPGITGAECIRLLKPQFPQTHFIIFSVFDDDENVFEALRAGATGYILKNSHPDDIYKAIMDVIKGGSPMSSTISRLVVNYFSSLKPEPNLNSFHLSAREKVILQLLSQGFRYKEIGEQLFISIDTVRTHVRNIYQKLQVGSRMEAVNKAFGK
jgi:DNA-binding NarL/FixJ family response regulator